MIYRNNGCMDDVLSLWFAGTDGLAVFPVVDGGEHAFIWRTSIKERLR